MPMINYSTLTYLINKIEVDLESNNFEIVESFFDSKTGDCSGKELTAPDRAVKNVLDFARAYQVSKSKHTGYVEMILN